MLRIYDVMLDAIEVARPLLRAIAAHDRDLANRLTRATQSVPLNIAEGSGSSGGARMARYRTALGSARETVAAIQVAERFGYVGPIPQPFTTRVNQVIGTLVRVTQ